MEALRTCMVSSQRIHLASRSAFAIARSRASARARCCSSSSVSPPTDVSVRSTTADGNQALDRRRRSSSSTSDRESIRAIRLKKIVSEIRKTMDSWGFIEVETPVLQGAAGGAEAKPFITYHNSLERNLYLRIATELHLKRMLVGGFDKVYEIGRIFRNEGISTRHNPEFTTIEMYEALSDYQSMMDKAEEIITRCALRVHGKLEIDYLVHWKITRDAYDD